MRVLIIDDDAEFVEELQTALKEAGYETHGVTGGKEALRAAFKFQPHLILLDIMMPEMDGWETCRRLRDFYDGLIIFLSVRNAEADRITGLDMGADDYIAKPFSLPELLARLRARLRTTHASANTERPTYVDPRLVIDLERTRVVKDGQFLQLTPTEFDLLACLVRHAGEVLSHKQLLSEALGAEYARELNYLKVYVGRIRDKLEDDPHHPRYIVTHRGVGYAFEASAAQSE